MSINLRNIPGSSSHWDVRRMDRREMSPSLLSSEFAVPVLSTLSTMCCSTMTSSDFIKSRTLLPPTTAVHKSTSVRISVLFSSHFAVSSESVVCGITVLNDSIRREVTFHFSRLGWLPNYYGLLLQDAIKFHFFQLFNRFYTIEPLHPEIPSILMELLLQLKKHPFHKINKQYFDRAQKLLSDQISPDVFKNLKIKENLESLSYLSSCEEMPLTIKVIDLAMRSTVHVREEEIRFQAQEAQVLNLMHSINFFYCGNASEVVEDLFENGESLIPLSLKDYPEVIATAITPTIHTINEGIRKINKGAKARGLSRKLSIQQLKSIVNKRKRLNPKTIQYAIAQIQMLINFSIGEYINYNRYLAKAKGNLQKGLLKSMIEGGISLDEASTGSLLDLHQRIILTEEDSNRDIEFLELFQYFLTSYQTSLNTSTLPASNIEDFWLQFHDHQVLSYNQKRKKRAKESLESKEEARVSMTRTSPEDPSVAALEADDSDIEEESEIEESSVIIRSSTKGSCSQWLDPLCGTLAKSLSSMPKKSSIVQKNANYHLRVLSLRLDLLHSCHLVNKHDLFPALGWGIIRNCANILEQTLVSDILRANPDQEMTEHSHIVLVRQLPTAATSSVTLQRELQQIAEFIDWGVVSSRYPHGTRQLCRRQGIAEPGHLHLLTHPWNDRNMHLLVNQMIGPLLRVLESRSDVKVSESILKSLLERSSSSSEASSTAHLLSAGFAHSLNSLITKRLVNLLSLSQAHAQTFERSSVPFQQKLSATWQDICYHLSGLQQQLRSWIAFPQSKYLIVHGDMILTHLQILDELMETALHAHLNQQEIRILHMHDLEAFRGLRDHQEEPALSQIVQGLNVGVREHYPYGLRNCSLFAVQWRLTTLQASAHDPEDINADLVLSKGKVVKIAQLQQQLLENIEGVITMTETRMKEFV